MTIEDIFDKWVVSQIRNQWITDDKNMEVYVRNTKHLINSCARATIDIANVTVYESRQRQGHFTRFLAHVEEYAREHGKIVFIENVMNNDLAEFLARRGYFRHGPEPHSYWRSLTGDQDK